MNKTSQAIALLISTASAGVTDIAAASPYQSGSASWMASKTLTATTNVSQAQSRTAGYTNANNLDGWTWTAVVPAKSVLAAAYMANAALEGSATTIAGSSSCVNCIAGGAVWCSRTFSYVISGQSVTTYNKDATSYNLGVQAIKSTSDATTWTSAAASDQGSCCNTAAEYVALVGLSGTAGVTTTWTFAAGTSAGQSSLTTGNAGPANACVASSNTPTGTGSDAAWAATTIDNSTTAFTSWWCSNGLYKIVTAAGNANRNAVQLLNQNDNQRLELALVGCPMIASRCGLLTTDTGVYTLADSTTVTTINMTKAMLMTTTDKCTWVAQSLLVAPTFKMTVGSAATAADNLGLTSNNWVIHHMEYMANAIAQTTFQANNGALIQQAASTTNGFQQVNQGLGYGNMVPKFTMPASQFATLRTWYGSSIGLTANNFPSGSVYGSQAGTWYSPYSNIASATKANQVFLAAMTLTQQYGNVSNIPYSNIADNTTQANVTSLQNYGNNSTSQRFDFRTVRYMPVSTAQTVWAAGSALNTQYTAATTSYTTAKTTWNAYVAILKKNAKMDAFAAAFSPPKAPTVPPLPNMPWIPAAYSGYLKQTPSQYAVMVGNQGLANNYVSGAQPTAQQFWASLDAAQTIGGWGNFTAAIIQFRDGWGKSFGTIGYSPGTGYNTMSQVWSVPAMCGSTTSISGQGSTTACDKVYSATANSANTPTAVNATANATFTFVTVISLWSKGSANTDATKLANGAWLNKNSIGLVFTGGEWSSTIQALGAISQPAAPTAADSLTGVAGASALAASSAAVLAIAALY